MSLTVYGRRMVKSNRERKRLTLARHATTTSHPKNYETITRSIHDSGGGLIAALGSGCATQSPTPAKSETAAAFISLFPSDGVPSGWRVGAWNDVSKPGPSNTVWRVKNGVLQPEGERGSWLMSEKEYGDFILEYEFKLGETGN